MDNFALDMKELATSRRIKLLCVPLIAKNSKSELIALTKLEVWWYLITKLYPNILKFAEPVITQFLNFCFGPLGDTPLLSTKVDVIASPGKRFHKTRLVAIDALLQLIVQKQEDRKAFPLTLEERLPHPIVEELFKDCYKAFLHSVGEAIIIIVQLNEIDVKDREEVIKVLLRNLMRYVRSTNAESKVCIEWSFSLFHMVHFNKNNYLFDLQTAVYNELILVVTELLNRLLELSCVLDFVRDEIVPELSTVAVDFSYRDRTLMDLLSKLIVPSVLKSFQKKHCDAIACLVRQAVKSTAQFHPETLKFLGTTFQQLEEVSTDSSRSKDCFELWFAYAEIAYKYTMACQDINEGTVTKPSFKTIVSIVRFPFSHMYLANSIEAQRIAVHWKDLYKQFESQADVLSTVKPNEILDNTAREIEECLMKNKKCYRIAAYCLEALLSTINYKFLLSENKVPSIVRLVADVTTTALRESRHVEAEFALKALASLLITVYGHSPEKALFYMKETRPTIELMLKTDAEENLVKEITSTWETIVSILRGLSTMLDANFLTFYRDTILVALKHPNAEISSQALSVLEMKDNLEEAARAILVELSQEAKKSLAKKEIKIKSDKVISSLKNVKITGSFLNRKIQSPKSSIVGKPKDKEERKLAPPPPEPDSQDYVVISSDVKLDVSRLTEHQKESLKRRRDDIPAMYNDLSQSSSQNTQDLQQWFDDKAKRTEAPNSLPADSIPSRAVAATDEKPAEEIIIDNISSSPSAAKVSEETAVVETKASSEISEDKLPAAMSTPETVGSSGQDPASVFEAVAEHAVPSARETSPPKAIPDVRTEKPTPSSVLSLLADHTYVGVPKCGDDPPDQEEPSEPVAKKLNFESREEYPEEKDVNPADSSLSDTTPSGKINRARRGNKSSTSSAEDTGALQNIRRTRLRNTGKSADTGHEFKSANAESQDIQAGSLLDKGLRRPKRTRMLQAVPMTAERGTKRKAASDSESEGSERDKRRRKSSSSPSSTPSDTESLPTHMDKRTEIEMSRLRIDMVLFDGPLPSKRRSKVNDESVNNESTGKRQHSPEMKVTRTKNGDNRTGESLRRSFRGQEKDGVPGADAGKKRRRRSNKFDESKGETQRDEVEGQATGVKNASRGKSKRSLQDSGLSSESQIIVDDEEAADDNVAADVEPERSPAKDVEDGGLNPASAARVPTPDISGDPVSKAMEAPSESDLDDVVESSQDSTSVSSTKKSATTLGKQIQKDELYRSMMSQVHQDTKHPRASSPINPSEGLSAAGGAAMNNLLEEKSTHDDSDETFLDISAIRPQLAEDVPADDAVQEKAPEESKTSATLIARPSEQSFNLSSPKNPSKRYRKPKSFASQGRAAHMLGLVTKLAVLEKDGQAEKGQVDEESTIRRSRSRDTENETPVLRRDRSGVVRDSERTGSPGGSRQEKIFNNMKAADYTASPPGKLLFGNLRNDGERVSPKMDKPAFDEVNATADSSGGKDQDGSAHPSVNERDELPILEWSSANPPSLTASPSASILKRNRMTIPEIDTDVVTTPNRGQRKRVSFADPPVSKEMGYEIVTGTSPLKPSKSTGLRGLLGRKDSPMRMKQSRFRMIQLDMEKMDEESEPVVPSSNDIDMECDRDNELLIKIAEDLEQAVESKSQDSNEGGSSSNVPMRINVSSGEVKIGSNTEAEVVAEDSGEEVKKSDSLLVEPVTIESQTQDDIFSSSDEKDESKRSDDHSIDGTTEETNTSSQNSTMESFKLNVTNDSVTGSIVTDLSREEEVRTNCLEDTVDARNLTSLNLTENPELSGRPARNGSGGESFVAEMDTLPVTDSLLTTQDSQGSTQPNVEIAQPELLNSTDAIYPSLIDCREPINAIIEKLANPLWIKNLRKYFVSRSLRTVGDLARLTEREIVRIPVKGSSKVDFVKRVLGRFEEKLRASATMESGPTKNTDSADYLALSPDKDVTLDIAEVTDIEDNVRDVERLPGDFSTLDATVAISQIEPTQNDSMFAENLDPLARHAIRRTSTTISVSGITIDPSSCSVLADPSSSSQTSTILLSPDSYPTAKVSVATSTDSLRKPLTKSVGSQTTLEELLDEIDVQLVLRSAVKRSSAETLLEQFKVFNGIEWNGWMDS